MELKDLRAITDELQKLTDSFRGEHDPRVRLRTIDRFKQLLLLIRVKHGLEAEVDSATAP
jgi:hypothetical protein